MDKQEAVKIARDWLSECDGDNMAESLAKLLVHARDATLMEAAKAMCDDCNKCEPIERKGRYIHPEGRWYVYCGAGSIHRLRAGKEWR